MASVEAVTASEMVFRSSCGVCVGLRHRKCFSGVVVAVFEAVEVSEMVFPE